MTRIIKYGFIVVVGFLITMSCSRNNTEGFEKLPKVKDDVLIEVLDSLHQQEVSYFYSKIGTKFKDSARSVSFKTSIRMINDSLINALIKYANIPIMNTLISPDSIIISNKREKCYVKQSLGYIKEQFGVDFTHENVEQFILGLPMGYEPEEKYYQVNGTDGYIIGSHRKKDIKKNERQNKKEIITYFKFSRDLSELKQTTIESPEDTTTIIINYETRELVDGMLLPKDVSLRIITPRQEISVNLDYNKTRINDEEQIYFIIPEDYGACE